MRQAVFLDRDGTINDDPGYVSNPDQMKLFPRSGEALGVLQRAGFTLVVVSNQSGVGRGMFPAERLPEIHDRLNALLKPFRVELQHFELCLHHPEEKCACRKPNPTLIQNAAARLGIDVTRSVMVGDRPADLGAGKRAGCGRVALVRTGFGAETERSLKPGEADFVGGDLLDVARWIVQATPTR